jgi:hypothetical protein
MASQTGTTKVCVALPTEVAEQLRGLSAVSNCTQGELITIGLQIIALGQEAQRQGGGIVLTDRDGQAQTEIRLPYSQAFQVISLGTGTSQPTKSELVGQAKGRPE